MPRKDIWMAVKMTILHYWSGTDVEHGKNYLLNTMMPAAVYCDIHNATLSEVSYLIKNMTAEEI
jgi:hypothetical protein